MDDSRASTLVDPESCLIVEDDPVLRRILRGHLARRGFRVAVAGSVAEALNELDRQAFSHLITDAILPDGHGFELVQRVRASAAPPVVIMMSGDESVGLTVAALHDPRARFLLKPFSMPRLEALMPGEPAAP
jgi:DNA-binding response OmpR family regulator